MKAYRALRISRICVQTVAFAAVVISLAMGIGCVVARMQIVTALLTGAALWIALWAAVTLLVGRVYCSSVCPSGSLMDIIARLTRGRKKRYSYSQPHYRLRAVVLVGVIVAAMVGLLYIVELFDPYKATTRIIEACIHPLELGLLGLGIATATFVLFAVTAYSRGRLICNTICPVGTLLGSLSRISVYHIDINTDICTGCNRCSDVCKSECIDTSSHVVDYSRCVVCFDCLDACNDGAISFRRGHHRLVMPMMQRLVSDSQVSTIAAPTNIDQAEKFENNSSNCNSITSPCNNTSTCSDT